MVAFPQNPRNFPMNGSLYKREPAFFSLHSHDNVHFCIHIFTLSASWPPLHHLPQPKPNKLCLIRSPLLFGKCVYTWSGWSCCLAGYTLWTIVADLTIILRVLGRSHLTSCVCVESRVRWIVLNEFASLCLNRRCCSWLRLFSVWWYSHYVNVLYYIH